MKYYGDINEDATIELAFNTFDSDGASVTVTDFASTDVHVHKDGNVAQSNAGVTIAIDFDGITGNHLIIIDTSADAFYATGSNYEVRVEGITVDAQTINAFIGAFSIENRYMVGTDGAITSLTPITSDKDSYKATSVTVSDKTGFSLSTAGILAIWHQAAAAIVSGIGLIFKTNVDAKISGANTTTPDAAGVVGAQLDSMSGATFDTSTDSLEAISNNGGSAAPTVTAIREELDSNSTQLADIVEQTDKLDNMITEDSGGNQFTDAALENVPDASVSADDIHTALDSYENKDDYKAVTSSGSGAITSNYYVYTDEEAKTGPVGECKVWVTSDVAGDTLVASGYTDSFGKVVFYLDAGVYYLWRKKTGYNFTNPDIETIA